jgi:hypothetical protein
VRTPTSGQRKLNAAWIAGMKKDWRCEEQTMRRFLIFLFVLLPPAEALGQYGYNPYAPVNAQQDPRVRRALRERAVAYAGEGSRPFIEKYGDDAVAACAACTAAGAKKLVEFYASGDLGKLPRPLDLLKVIALPGHGDDALLWAIQHARELTDVDNFDAFLLTPLDYAYSLKPLDQGAAECRARRLAAQAAVTPTPQPQQQPQPPVPQIPLDNRTLAWGGGALVVLVLIVWWKRRQSAGGMGV